MTDNVVGMSQHNNGSLGKNEHLEQGKILLVHIWKT